MKFVAALLVTLSATVGFAQEMTTLRCHTQGDYQIPVTVVTVVRGGKTFQYVNGRLARLGIKVNEQNPEVTNVSIMGVGDTVRAVLDCATPKQ